MPRQTLEFSGTLDADTIAGYFEELAVGLRRGLVSLGTGADSVELSVPASVALKVQAKAASGKGRSSLEIKLDLRQPRPKPGPAEWLIIRAGSVSEAPVDAPAAEGAPEQG